MVDLDQLDRIDWHKVGPKTSYSINGVITPLIGVITPVGYLSGHLQGLFHPIDFLRIRVSTLQRQSAELLKETASMALRIEAVAFQRCWGFGRPKVIWTNPHECMG